MEHDPFDPEFLRLPERLIRTPETVAKAERIAKRRQQQFIQLPLSWVDRLKTAHRAATLKIAHHLLFQCWKSNSWTISLSNIASAAAGVSRREKWRALAELEQLGLIRVERRPRRSPVIEILLK